MARSTKEIAKKPVTHPVPASRSSVEESFGPKPPKIAVGGGEMCTFGHKPHDGVWPTNVVSPDQKTGFPKGYDQTKKSPKP